MRGRGSQVSVRAYTCLSIILFPMHRNNLRLYNKVGTFLMNQLICVAVQNCYYTEAISGHIRSAASHWNVVCNKIKKYSVRFSSRCVLSTNIMCFSCEKQIYTMIKYAIVTLNYSHAFRVAVIAWTL